MPSLEGRLLALETTASSSRVCAACREEVGASTCPHFGLFLSLVPRIEFASATEWLCVRESGLQALEAPNTGGAA